MQETLEPCDIPRLAKQRADVWRLVQLGAWWTLRELSQSTGHPEASVSARLRDFRKPRYGGHVVERQRIVEGRGTWRYRIVLEPDRPPGMPQDRDLTPSPTLGPRPIGTIFRAYCLGRDDARFGRWVAYKSDQVWSYRLGFKDEMRRMAEEKRLAQLELPLFERSERRQAPRRRATERASSAPLTELDIPPAR